MRKIFSVTAIVCAVFLTMALTSFPFVSADWTTFHGDPSHSGAGTDNLTATPTPLWNFSTGGQVWSSPAVVGGVVYIGSLDDNAYALNATTGALIWRFTTGYSVYASPTVVNGVVYLGSQDGKVYALKAESGALVWNFSTGAPINSSPTVVGGVVYIGSDSGFVYALNASTGATVWTYQTGKAIGSIPAVAGGVVYIGSENGIVYALNANTGAKVWSFTTGNEIWSPATVVGGVVYVGSWDDNVYALNANTGAKIWSYTTGSYVDSSPAVVGGVVYVGSLDGSVYALNANTGAKVWRFTTGSGVGSSAAVVDGVVYIGSHDGSVYALNAKTGVKLWSYATGNEVRSSPALVGGVLYVGSLDDNVYAIGSISTSSSSITGSSSSVTGSSSSASSSSTTSSSASNSSASSLLQQVWVPKPTNAVEAIAIFAVAAEAVSLGLSLINDPLAEAGGKVGERTKGLIPDNIKDWLEENVSSKREIAAKDKIDFKLWPTNSEDLAYITAIIVLTLSFSYVKVSALSQIWELIPVFFATSILVGFAQKFFSILFLRSRGVWSEHKIWPFGLGIFLVSTLVFKVPFSSPTRSVHQSKKFTERVGALASVTEIIVGLAFTGLFFLLLREGYAAVGGAGLAMCVIGSFSSTFPVAPMSGKDIFDNSKPVWVVLFITTMVIFVAWLLLL